MPAADAVRRPLCPSSISRHSEIMFGVLVSRPLPYRPPGVLLGPRLRTDHSFFSRENPVALGAAHSMVAAASGQQMVSFDADSCLSSGHTAWLNSWVMGRVHQS